MPGHPQESPLPPSSGRSLQPTRRKELPYLPVRCARPGLATCTDSKPAVTWWCSTVSPVECAGTLPGSSGPYCRSVVPEASRVVTDAGIDCRRAADGSPQWATTWVAKNASQQWPALELHEPCRWSATLRHHRRRPPLRRVTDGFHSRIPTAASGPQSPPGIFVLTSLRLDTSKVVTRLPLPAFVDAQSSGIAISLASPPGVLAVGDGLALMNSGVRRGR